MCSRFPLPKGREAASLWRSSLLGSCVITVKGKTMIGIGGIVVALLIVAFFWPDQAPAPQAEAEVTSPRVGTPREDAPAPRQRRPPPHAEPVESAAVPKSSCSLSGRVLDDTGTPVAEALVTLRRQEQYVTVEQVNLHTDSSGGFDFGVVQPSWYRLGVAPERARTAAPWNAITGCCE